LRRSPQHNRSPAIAGVGSARVERWSGGRDPLNDAMRGRGPGPCTPSPCRSCASTTSRRRGVAPPPRGSRGNHARPDREQPLHARVARVEPSVHPERERPREGPFLRGQRDQFVISKTRQQPGMNLPESTERCRFVPVDPASAALTSRRSRVQATHRPSANQCGIGRRWRSTSGTTATKAGWP
jgi:hypothetical protein